MASTFAFSAIQSLEFENVCNPVKLRALYSAIFLVGGLNLQAADRYFDTDDVKQLGLPFH